MALRSSNNIASAMVLTLRPFSFVMLFAGVGPTVCEFGLGAFTPNLDCTPGPRFLFFFSGVRTVTHCTTCNLAALTAYIHFGRFPKSVTLHTSIALRL